LGKLHDKELAMAVMALYQLWLARNETRDGSPIIDPLDVARRVIFLVDEWAGLKPLQVPKPVKPTEGWQRFHRKRVMEGAVWFLGTTMVSSWQELAIF
jgi:hypothetical protein